MRSRHFQSSLIRCQMPVLPACNDIALTEQARLFAIRLFLDRSRPVDDDRQFFAAGLLGRCVDEESLPIFRYRVMMSEEVGGGRACAEENLRRSSVELTGCVDRHRHHRPVPSEIKQFFAIRSPAGLMPSLR